MAEPLKNVYQRAFFTRLMQDFRDCGTPLPEEEFIRRIFDEAWEERELKERIHHITRVLYTVLDRPYEETLMALKPVAARQSPDFSMMFFPDYVAVYGLEEDWETSIEALAYFTQFSTSEFAVRPFILKDPARMMQQMEGWATHENHHLRRLASEGCRPRLPWAMALPAFKKDPRPILPILERLKNDPSLYVRRSVANNLNDISKDHPDLVLSIAQQWQGQSPATDWIVKHACRGMLKQGLPAALRLFGFGDPERAMIHDLQVNQATITIGETLMFTFQLRHAMEKNMRLRLEYGIYYHKANGQQSRKVFMITENGFAPRQDHPFRRTQSFRNLTTRKHYPGPHRLVIIVNGEEKAAIAFEVVN